MEGVSLTTEISFCQHSLFTLFGLAECHLRLCHRPINTALDVEVPPPKYVTLELFCTCQMPETYGVMVECEECGEWFYLKCMRLTKEPTEDELL